MMTDFEQQCFEALVWAYGVEGIVGLLHDLCQDQADDEGEDSRIRASFRADAVVLQEALDKMKANDEAAE